jgi:hypothetical protein
MLLKLKLSQRKPFRKCIYRLSKASYTPKDQGWSSPQGLDWRTTFFLTGEEEKGGSGESKFPSSRMQPSLPLSIWLQRIRKTKRLRLTLGRITSLVSKLLVCSSPAIEPLFPLSTLPIPSAHSLSLTRQLHPGPLGWTVRKVLTFLVRRA